MSNRRLNTRLSKPPAATISPRPQVVAHKSTGGILNSFPEPVDPVGNASHRLTNDTVALPSPGEVLELNTFSVGCSALTQEKKGQRCARSFFFAVIPTEVEGISRRQARFFAFSKLGSSHLEASRQHDTCWQTRERGRTCAGTHAGRRRWLRRSRVPERLGIKYPLRFYSRSKVSGRQSRLAARDLSAAVEMTESRDEMTEEAADIAENRRRAFQALDPDLSRRRVVRD